MSYGERIEEGNAQNRARSRSKRARIATRSVAPDVMRAEKVLMEKGKNNVESRLPNDGADLPNPASQSAASNSRIEMKGCARRRFAGKIRSAYQWKTRSENNSPTSVRTK